MRLGQLLAVAVAGAASLVSAAAMAQEADGKKLFMTKSCVACHGKDASKAILKYPNLAGQEQKYLLQQMVDIKSGARGASNAEDGNPRTKGMADIMHLVDEPQMKAIATWLSGLPAVNKPATEDAARIKEGEALYKKSGCLSCHGPEGKKPLPAHPYLAGMKADYAVLQMKDIRDGVRTNGKSKTMVSFIKKLSDEQMQLISDYLSTIKR